ncbi:pyruvate kinase [Aromatoleum toluclasticum]|uniref:pyruvate kinase n=1 Tax=Aromatoleum toluclasticum TaxID=92003 RepID=UPI001D181D4F|nr:pyruvate kinase [Aromatoleum toluclasticum]MCC4117706.1 pyruvate kinase [Aromatoleum toluclasticum]
MPGKNTKIIATVGPASADEDSLRTLAESGADVFRLNFSHGTHADHHAVYQRIRAVEEQLGRPIGVLIDLQGPKLRLGTFGEGGVTLARGDRIRFDLDPTPGDATRVAIPHPEIIDAVGVGHVLLVDDGKMRLQVVAKRDGVLEMEALTDGRLSDRKGVNVPDVALPLSALTAKDRRDLTFGLELGIDWVALSFVQRAEDIAEARALIGDKALLMAKIEKPSALAELEDIIALADGIMVARGDLGVELPPEDVPGLQKRIVRLCRRAGKPVVVATQMLESMISAPAPTRAEASDVATAVFDGADAVMLSAETASGKYPVDALAMMNRIIARTEADPLQRQLMEAVGADPKGNTTDAIGTAIRAVAATLPLSATVAFTASGATALRIAHQRPRSPILGLTPSQSVARRLCLVWGVRSRRSVEACAVEEIVNVAIEHCRAEGLTAPGQAVVVTAGVPFGTPGSTNLLRLAWPAGDTTAASPSAETEGEMPSRGSGFSRERAATGATPLIRG